jgi:hypothetical protein
MDPFPLKKSDASEEPHPSVELRDLKCNLMGMKFSAAGDDECSDEVNQKPSTAA